MMEDLSLHILDIAENAIAAGATRITVNVNENEKRNLLMIRISDNGAGMSKEAFRRAFDPFFTTKKKRTGLGLPLLAQAAEQSGGAVSIATVLKKGTTITARFRYRHIDRPPLTKMKETMSVLILGHPEIDFHYCHGRNGRVFKFFSRRFLKESGAPSWTNAPIIEGVNKKLQDGLKRIGIT